MRLMGLSYYVACDSVFLLWCDGKKIRISVDKKLITNICLNLSEEENSYLVMRYKFCWLLEQGFPELLEKPKQNIIHISHLLQWACLA